MTETGHREAPVIAGRADVPRRIVERAAPKPTTGVKYIFFCMYVINRIRSFARRVRLVPVSFVHPFLHVPQHVE